jgi:hypothetical protein
MYNSNPQAGDPNFLNKILNSNQQKMMSCSANYKNGLDKKIIKLKDCDNMLRTCMAESNSAIDDFNFWKWMTGLAQVLKLTADVSLSLLEKPVDALTGGIGGKGINLVYGQAQMIAGFVQSPPKNNAEGAAVAGKQVLGDSVKMADAIMDSTKAGKALLKKTKDKNLGTIMSLYDYIDQAAGIYKTLSESPSGISAAQKSLSQSIVRVRGQIAKAEVELAKCA